MNNETKQTLYDFLYVDENKISSYYSQFFEGFIEKYISKSTSTETFSGQGGLTHFLKAEMNYSEKSDEEMESIINPKDFLTNDILHHLFSNGFIHDEKSITPNNLCMVQGDLFFIDNSVITFMLESLDSMKDALSNDELGVANTTEKKQLIKMLQGMKKMLNNKPFQPALILTSYSSGVSYCGTYKEQFLIDNVMSFYFKHGTGGISDIYMVGIVEDTVFNPNENSFVSAAGKLANALNSMVFPDNKRNIFPIALFRKLNAEDVKKDI